MLRKTRANYHNIPLKNIVFHTTAIAFTNAVSVILQLTKCCDKKVFLQKSPLISPFLSKVLPWIRYIFLNSLRKKRHLYMPHRVRKILNFDYHCFWIVIFALFKPINSIIKYCKGYFSESVMSKSRRRCPYFWHLHIISE